jgi:hypothetical protein
MNLDEFIRDKQEKLERLEQVAEDRAKAAGGTLNTQIDSFRTKRDELVARLEALKTDAEGRVEILKMGIESAWDELQAAFEMATKPHPQAPSRP